MITSTSTYVTFRDAWCKKIDTKANGGAVILQPADKQINEKNYTFNLPPYLLLRVI